MSQELWIIVWLVYCRHWCNCSWMRGHGTKYICIKTQDSNRDSVNSKWELGETEVRLRLGSVDTFRPVTMQGLSHNCIHPSDFFLALSMSNSLRHRNFCSWNTEIPIGYCKFTPGISSPAWWYTSGTRNRHIIEAKLEKGFEDKTGTQGILEDSRELRGKTEINLARSLVIPRQTNSSPSC